MRIAGRSQTVLDYLQKQPGVVISLKTICSDLGLDSTVVSSAIHHLINRVGVRIDRTNRGFYTYLGMQEKVVKGTAKPGRATASITPTTATTVIGAIYESVGRGATGKIVVRDVEGILYWLENFQ